MASEFAGGRLGARLVALVGVALMLCGAWAVQQDLPASLLATQSIPAQFDLLAKGRPAEGISVPAATAAMSACVTALDGLYGRLRPTNDRLRVAANCAATAGALTARNPTFAYAWYAKAVAELVAGDAREMNLDLRASVQAGPSEAWLAALRSNLAEAAGTLVDDEGAAAQLHDLALLLGSWRGAQQLAERYVDSPSSRRRIVAAAETLEPDVQVRFLAVLADVFGGPVPAPEAESAEESSLQ